MKQPRQWTLKKLEHDIELSAEQFRKERADEPLRRYTAFFQQFTPIFHELVRQLPQLISERDPTNTIVEIVSNTDKRTAFRYLAAPPISEDDLKTLAQSTLSAQALRRDPSEADRIRKNVLHILDPHRFPWVEADKKPTKSEQETAVVASAALVAARKVETERRQQAGRKQEKDVAQVLEQMQFRKVKSRDIPNLKAAPEPGTFCGECLLGEVKADIALGLHDQRTMAIECKASNSAVNSHKRINHEAVGKATKWISDFGRNQIVPGAVIAGVFSAENLRSAQASGLALFWSHRLNDLRDFIASCHT